MTSSVAEGIPSGKIFAFGMVGLVIYLLASGDRTFLIHGLLLFLAYIGWKHAETSATEITMVEGETIALKEMSRMQSLGNVYDGTITPIPEKQMRLFITPSRTGSQFKPFSYDFVFKIDTGKLPRYYHVAVSKFGTILKMTETKGNRGIDTLTKQIEIIKAPPEEFQRRERKLQEEEKNARE